jgi:hypothetical protein
LEEQRPKRAQLCNLLILSIAILLTHALQLLSSISSLFPVCH